MTHCRIIGVFFTSNVSVSMPQDVIYASVKRSDAFQDADADTDADANLNLGCNLCGCASTV